HPALRPVNGNISEDHHIFAVLQLKFQGEAVVLEENAGDGRALIFEGKIPVSRPMVQVVGDLPSCPEVMQAGIILQAIRYPLIQVGDSEYLGQCDGVFIRPDI
ncbi:MAG: hypothetical protein QG575_2084, partial [Euryarchaeota archaeon]|nr:hypothetical protein [Euryarchaeota archaeon]